jgi:putative ABC transport system ATP-binding protein
VLEIRVEDVHLSFGKGQAATPALRGATFTVRPNEFTMVAGPSGSGKTSVLSLVGALVTPTSGRVLFGDRDLSAMRPNALAELRRKDIGYVFQAFRLMAGLSAEENVRMSLDMRGVANPRKLAREALEGVGLAAKLHLRPDQMSGGEKQRVAVARALAHDPAVILADEPTASLDRESGARVGEMLKEASRRPGRFLVVVSHDDRLVPQADRIIRMEDGRVQELAA